MLFLRGYKLISKKIKIDNVLQKFNQVFESNGFKAYLVGGAVRDIFLNKPCSDWDVATNAKPEDVMKMFNFVVPTGIAHGTVTVHFMKEEIEVTTFRTESDYSDGRHPDKIEYAATIEEDLSRRDFTMNAIAVDLKNGKIVDPFGGQKDIKKKIIRTVGNPHERFMEDGLRPVRALRFASQLNFSIEKKTYLEIFKNDIQKKTLSISVERFRDEFMKMMKSERPSVGLKLMEETGILNLFIPEFTECRGCVQSDKRGYHQFDVLDHLFYACDGAPKSKPLVRLAALLHDIGKPKAKRVSLEDGFEKITFYNHDFIGSEKAIEIMTRLKFSNKEIEHVSHLIKNHMYHYETNWSDGAVRRFIVRVGKENIEDLFDLRLSDIYGMHNCAVSPQSLSTDLFVEFSDRIKNVLSKDGALSLKDLKINGNDLVKLGVQGKKIGIILNELFESVLEDPEMNDHEKLMTVAKSYL